MPFEDWIEHRRPGDRELLGYVRPDGEGFVAIDRLGRELTDVVDWMTAEQALDERGLGWLSGLWQLIGPDGTVERVRLVEVGTARVLVKTDDLGAVDAQVRTYELPFPAPPTLEPFRGDAGQIDRLPR
jgi:hypothetical protein